MPWNPNVPTVTNRVQDDLDAIRENFQHLDQLAERVDELQTVSELAERVDELQTVSELAERVDELQTVSELAPIANDLQAVSGLAPVAGELQAISGLAQIADDLQVVSELAPYVQAILDSRIVEMGSNSNGTYVRWENGLQLCFNTTATFAFAAADSGSHTTLSFPAQFSTLTYNIQVSLVRDSTDFAGMHQLTIGAFPESVSQFRLLYSNNNSYSLTARVAWSAWGMWK